MIRKKNNLFKSHAPFLVVMLYVLASIAMFWFGPMPWPVDNPFQLASFQAVAVLLMAIGYLSGNQRLVQNVRGINLRPFFYFGTLSVIAMQVPLTLTYTDKYPWDVLQAVMDQRQVYEEMIEQAAVTQGSRFFVPLLRAFFSPFFYLSVGYGLLNFRRLSVLQKVLLFVVLICPVNLSLLRGTDKELVDIAVILCGFLIVSYFRRGLCVNRTTRGSSISVLRLGIIACILISLFFMVFAHRRLSRLGGNIDFCVADGLICADYSGLILSSLPDFISFGYAMISAYISNGYYGLSLALGQPFESSFGLGHSAALLGLYEKISGSADLFDSTLVAQVSEAGWDHRYYWVSLFTWIANDVGFVGSLLVVAVLARWFRQAWIDAVYSKNDLAAIVFVLLCIVFLYLPANNQITQTFDMYFAFIAALIAWKATRRISYRSRVGRAV